MTGLLKGCVTGLLLAMCLALAPISAKALTIIPIGPGVNNLGDVNIAGDVILQGVTNGSGGINANTYVDPYLSTANINAAITILGPAGPNQPTGSWGGTALNFQLTPQNSWLATLTHIFTGSGPLNGAQLIINWVNASNDPIQVTLTAVPVPAAGFLFVAALGGLGLLGRMRSKRHSLVNA